jgi:hypothetical protein
MPLGWIEKLGVIETERDVSALIYVDDVNVLGGNQRTGKKNAISFRRNC